MFRVSLANVFAHRTLRPLHEKHQATPKQVTLDSSLAQAGTEIFSGFAAELSADNTVIIADNSTTIVAGLFALDRNNTINDLDNQPTDLAPFAIWQGGPDAYFQLDAPAFDDNESYAAGDTLVVADTGMLTLSAASGGGYATKGTVVVAEVYEVPSASRLVIRLDAPNSLN